MFITNKQNPEREIKHICGLGAKVECERFYANIQPAATKVTNMLYFSFWVRLFRLPHQLGKSES